MTYGYFVRDYVAVVGQYPEFADYDNPRGYLHDIRYVIVAENPDGYRLQLNEVFASADDAKLFLRTLADDAPTSADWVPQEPSYGSAAYVREGCEEERWLEERHEAYSNDLDYHGADARYQGHSYGEF